VAKPAKPKPSVFDLLMADAAKWVARPHDERFPDESWEIVIPHQKHANVFTVVANSVDPAMVPALMALPAMLATFKEVLQRWTFDDCQCHTHTWHDMQDCAAKIRAVMTAAGGAAHA
jgi:hypothetical protein